MDAVSNTLEERGETYGDYTGGIKFRTELKKLIYARYESVHNKPMTREQEEYFSDVIMKISRLAVSPEHKDSWHDLAGYALLMEGVLNNEKR